MFKWLKRFHERYDEEFMQTIQNPKIADKKLANLYRNRIMVSIGFLVIFTTWILVIVISPNPSNATGSFLGLSIGALVNAIAIDTQIKMIQMINYLKATSKFEKEASTTQDVSLS